MRVDDVKPRTERPSLRQEQAAVTRRRILDAARLLFFREGYAATTLKAIAQEAGVAVQTVYAVFGSKATILAELRWQVVTLPEADDAFQASLREPTIERRLAGFAHSIRRRWELAGDIVKVNEDAARVDPEVRAAIAPARERRHRGIASFVEAVARELAPALDVPRATALVDALSMYDVYGQLVGVHGWSPDAYEAWLRGSLVASVVREAGPTPPVRRTPSRDRGKASGDASR